MKTRRPSVAFAASVAAALAHASAQAQQPVITSFHGNGQLTWTNVAGTNGFRVQWAPAVTGPWSSNWRALDSIFSTGAQTTVSVPMFYRVAEGFSTASMRGLWIGWTPAQGNNVYYRAEDNGLISEFGAFNLRTPAGYFSVSPSGTVTMTVLSMSKGPVPFTFQLGLATNAFGNVSRVDNAALCAGSWIGTLSQTKGPGAPSTYPLSFEVDSSGWLLNFAGFSPVVTGRLFAVTNGAAAGFITTGETGPYNQIQVSGTLTGNSLTGNYYTDSGPSSSPNAVLGTISLTRQ